MKRVFFVLAMMTTILATRAAPAQTLTVAGAPLDHLVCYRTLDKLTLKTTTDLIAQLQPEFSQRGCTLIKPIEFCVPATKINVSPVPPDPNIVGTPLRNDYVCYLARCPNPLPPPDKQVIDQFGARLQQNYKVTKVCVPARKAPAGCGRVGKVCQGECPNPTDLCKLQKVAGAVECNCVHQDTCKGRPDAAGMCGGDCPNATDKCLPTLITPNPTSTKQTLACTCRPPVDNFCSLDTTTHTCGGACPLATDVCQSDPLTGKCTCGPSNPPCQVTGTTPTGPQCGGACPNAGQTCAVDTTTGKCSCQPPPQCHQDVGGLCGGDCPSGMICTLNSAGQCTCADTPCGSNGSTPPQCSGACPLASQTCSLDASGACNCTPPMACQSDAATNACGGNCPAPMQCRNVAGTTNCQCQ